jgi:single-strand DNA-binding protein
MDLNKVFIIGRLTNDIQLRVTPSGQPVATFGVATNRTWNDKAGQRQKQTEFHNVVVWGRQAEIMHQYLKKGALVFIEGRIQTRAWEDKQGMKRSRTEIIVDRFQFGPKTGGEAQDSFVQPPAAESAPVDSEPAGDQSESFQIDEPGKDEPIIDEQNPPF